MAGFTQRFRLKQFVTIIPGQRALIFLFTEEIRWQLEILIVIKVTIAPTGEGKNQSFGFLSPLRKKTKPAIN